MSGNQSFFDKMSAKADELKLQRKAEDLADAVVKMAQTAVGKAGDYVQENRDKVDGMLDKAAAKVDDQTEGKYHDKVAKAREAATRGITKLTEKTAAADAAAGNSASGSEPAPGADYAPHTDDAVGTDDSPQP